MNNLKMTILASLAALPLLAPTARAGDTNIIVRYQTQELASESGTAKLYLRIARAASRVCGDRETAGSRLPSSVWRSCVQTSIERAVAAVDSQTLYAYHDLQVQRSRTRSG